MRIKFIVLLPFAVALFSVSLSSCNNLSNIFEYDVVAEPITKEVFEEAYSHRLEYNLVRDTSSLDWFTKKKIEVAIFRTLDDDEKESYVWEDYSIYNIGKYPTGEYVADLASANWLGCCFLNGKFEIEGEQVQTNAFPTYSSDGIYVGCRDFDCDPVAYLSFYSKSASSQPKMHEIARYIDNLWFVEGLDEYEELLIWYEGSLYCTGTMHGSYQPCYWKLDLVKR